MFIVIHQMALLNKMFKNNSPGGAFTEYASNTRGASRVILWHPYLIADIIFSVISFVIYKNELNEFLANQITVTGNGMSF